MKIKDARVTLAIVCIIVGIMIAVQYRANLLNSNNISYQQWSEINLQIEDLNKQKNRSLGGKCE